MNTLEIVALCVGGYGGGWGMTTYIGLKSEIERHGYLEGEDAFAYGALGLVWPLALIPMAARHLVARQYKTGKTKLSRTEKRQQAQIEHKRRELTAAQEVHRIQDEIDRLARL